MRRSNTVNKVIPVFQSEAPFSSLLTPIELSSLSAQDRALARAVTFTTSASDSNCSAKQSDQCEDQEVATELVGLECVYCASSPLISVPKDPLPSFTKVFPGSIENIGASLQLLREKHYSAEAALTNQRCILLPIAARQVFDMTDHDMSVQRYSANLFGKINLQTCCIMVADRLGIRNKTPGSKEGIIFSPTAVLQRNLSSKDESSSLRPLAGEGTLASGNYAASSSSASTSRAMVRPLIDSIYIPEMNTRALPNPLQFAELLGPYQPKASSARMNTEQASKYLRAETQMLPHGGRPSISPAIATPYMQASSLSFFRDGLGWSCPLCFHLSFRAEGSFHQEMPPREEAMKHFIKCTAMPHYSSFPSYCISTSYGHASNPTMLSPANIMVKEEQNYLMNVSTTENERSCSTPLPRTTSLSENPVDVLAMPEDKLLLTDYFYFINQQLCVCHFKEEDRKTRGGKRKDIEVGSGGIACRHCYGQPYARKFFWKDVDRLANSFSEIVVHVLKCAYCPEEVKITLMELKSRHTEQMSKKPRGWQKVFFRRMWRRIHGNQGLNDDGTQVQLSGEETPHDSTKSERVEDENAVSLPCSRGACLLAIPEDKQWLSDSDCLIRNYLEVFAAEKEHLRQHHQSGKKGSIRVGQVGIRCIYCASSPEASFDKTSFIYPATVSDVYDSVREIQKFHFSKCVNIPEGERAKLATLKTASSCSSVIRRYYIIAAQGLKLGLYDTDAGIRAKHEVQKV